MKEETPKDLNYIFSKEEIIEIHSKIDEEQKIQKCSTKINLFCMLIRNALKTIDYQRYILSYLSTYTKMNPPNYEIILETIKQRKEVEMNQE